MGNLTVVVLGKLGYSNGLGKKGTSSDITLFNLKKGQETVTFVEPMRYPDRLAPLFYACSLATKAIVIVNELNALLGEQLVMLQCCGLASGYFVLQNYVSKNKFKQLVKGTILENYTFMTDDKNELRESLILEAAKINPSISENGEKVVGIVPIDHTFNVKGIGTVILGIVSHGSIQKHNELNVLPGNKIAQIRSIQKHDDEFDSGHKGDRVGLALKNVKVEDVDRGVVLTNDVLVKTSKVITGRTFLVKYWLTPLKVGMVVHLGHWMQVLNCKVETINNDGDWRNPTLTLKLEKEIVYSSNDLAVLMYLDGGKLRVAGTIELK